MRLWTVLAPALLAFRAFAQPVSLSRFADHGAFLVYLNEEHPARITFDWTPDGSFHDELVVHLRDLTARSSLTLIPDAEGRWIHSEYVDSHQNKTILDRKGLDMAVSGTDKKGSGKLPDDAEIFPFEVDSPALITAVLWRYDAVKGGAQTFGVMGMHKLDGGPLTVERQDAFERAIDGRKLKLTNWLFAKEDFELRVVAGEDGRVYLVGGIPGFEGAGISEPHAFYVREGFESLLPKPIPDPLVSQPKYEVRADLNVRIPMRDGVKLSTDIFFPVGVAKAPVILARTPYSKTGDEILGYFYARRGYIYAFQDVRGRHDSEGKWEAVVNEPKDGYDTIEWLARQPWSTGKVGMVGASYVGWVQWLAAIEHPPHLVTIVPNVSPPDPFHNLPYDNGVFGLRVGAPWLFYVESNILQLEDANKGKDWDVLLKALPLTDLDQTVLGRQSLTWRQWIAHPTVDNYWRPVMFLDKLKNLRLPVFHQSGWFDGDGIGTKLNYLAMARYRHPWQKMTVGPWDHSDTASRSGDGRVFGASAVIDLQRDYLRWFDYWLKGIDNGILKEPLVSIFVMGSNRWLYGPQYPLPQTRFEKLYLSGSSRLTFDAPPAGQGEDHYVYDPADPTPEDPPAERKDFLTYTTAPFDKPYTIAGPVSAVLYASSSARDTDWFVHLVDIDPDGKPHSLWANSEGHIRARYRNSMVKTEPIEPGKVYRYTIDMWHTGITLAPGHRLRVEVASAAFPLFSRNLNTGGDNQTETGFVKASQSIYHDARRASYILLPRIPD